MVKQRSRQESLAEEAKQDTGSSVSSLKSIANLIESLREKNISKVADNPFLEKGPFMIPRDKEGNIIPFKQPDPKPFIIPRDKEGNIIPFDPNEGIQLLGGEYGGTINRVPTTKEGITAYTEKFLELNDEGQTMFRLYTEKYPDKDINLILDIIMSKPEYRRIDMIEEEKKLTSKANGGIVQLFGNM